MKILTIGSILLLLITYHLSADTMIESEEGSYFLQSK